MGAAGHLDGDGVPLGCKTLLVVRRKGKSRRPGVKDSKSRAVGVLIGLNGYDLVAVAVPRWVERNGQRRGAGGSKSKFQRFHVQEESPLEGRWGGRTPSHESN